MPAIAYREHLDFFARYHKSSVSYSKLALSFAAALLITFSLSFYLSKAQNKKIEPANQQVAYFESVNSSYFKAKQSLEEVSSSLQVAGAKTQKIESLKEASSSAQVPGYFITLGDIQKMTQQLITAKDNLKSLEVDIKNLSVPPIYETLDNQIKEYISQSVDLLTKMEATQVGLKDLVLASTPNFFLPTLSNEPVWQSQDKEKIKEFYLKKKQDAERSQESFAKLQTSQELQNYKELQLSYFRLVTNVSDNIVKVMEKPTAEDPQSQAQLIEEGYQVLVGAQRENEIIAQKLLEERINLTSSQVYQNMLASLKNRTRAIESGLTQGNQIQNLKSQEIEAANRNVFDKLDFRGFTN